MTEWICAAVIVLVVIDAILYSRRYQAPGRTWDFLPASGYYSYLKNKINQKKNDSIVSNRDQKDTPQKQTSTKEYLF